MKRSHPVSIYIAEILHRDVVAGVYEIRACERYRRERRHATTLGLRFDEKSAQHAIDYFQFLRHSKGEWAGHEFKLAGWQQFIVWNLFGWRKRVKGVRKLSASPRRFTEAYISVARKNGKTTLLSGIGLYLTDGDREPGAEVYTVATKFDQARILHGEAVRMVAQSAELREFFSTHKDVLTVPTTFSKFEPLGSDSKHLDGLNVHGAMIDELHAHRNGDLYELMTTGTAARREPLVIAITTAGDDKSSFCGAQHDFGEKILDQVVTGSSTFVYIAQLDPDDDWTDPKIWRKANPSLGVTITSDGLATEVETAIENSRRENGVRRLRLNEWTRSDVRFLNLQKWNKNETGLLPAELESKNAGRLCYAGLDLSSTTDISALVLLFPPDPDTDDRFDVVCRFWIPDEDLAVRARRTRVQYVDWVREGWITACPGPVIDYRMIRAEINALADVFVMPEIAFDPWNAVQLSLDLADDGFRMVKFRQGFVSMTAPTKELERMYLAKLLDHGGNPVLRWMADNLSVDEDAAGNIKPKKPGSKKSHKKIDGMVSLIEAIDRAGRNEGVREEVPEPMVGGIRTL